MGGLVAIRGAKAMSGVIALAVAIVTWSCASGGGGRGARAGCALRAADSVFAGAGPVYRDCAVSRRAHLTNPDVRFDFRPATTRTSCFAVELEFVVDQRGKPEVGGTRVIRANDQSFADAVIASLPQWRYEPAVLDGAPVRQIVAERRSMASLVVVVPKGVSPTTAQPMPRPPSC